MRLPRKRRADRTGNTDDTCGPEQREGGERRRRATGRAKSSKRAGRRVDRKARRRLIDFPRRGRRGWRRWTPSWKLISGLFLLFAGSLAGLFIAVYMRVEIPNPHDSASRQATVYYWADGSRMVSVGDVNRQDVALSQVPDSVQRAVVAAENADFYSDSGVSVTGIGRAAVNIVKGKETQGGSTITQQYVKNTYLSQDQTVERKIKELFLSLKVSRQQPKTEILEGYLNTSWFGRDAYGVQAASYAYYGIPAKELNPSQGALLAAVLKGAESFDPSLSADNHQRAEDRWSWILDRQVDTGSMSAEERAKYTKFPEPKPSRQADQPGRADRLSRRHRQQVPQEPQRDHGQGSGRWGLQRPHHLRERQGARAGQGRREGIARSDSTRKSARRTNTLKSALPRYGPRTERSSRSTAAQTRSSTSPTTRTPPACLRPRRSNPSSTPPLWRRSSKARNASPRTLTPTPGNPGRQSPRWRPWTSNRLW
ncbi:hypothetical protein GCM10020254_80080 [Streptomyces goshikiensis]